MRQLSPAFIVTSLALALASNSVLAQVSRTGTTAPTTNTATSTTGDAAPSETNGLSGVNVTAPASGSTTATSTPSGASNSSAGASNPAVTGDATANGMQSGLIVPGAVTSVDAGVNANGERTATSNAGAPNANSNVNQAATPTPLFELAARQGMAKEAARRARGEEPRVYGIAPRTDRDLTRQMPDDPIIRY